MNSENYKIEKIPVINILLKGIKESYKNDLQNKSYKFYNIYEELSPNKFKIKSDFTNDFDLNTKTNKNSKKNNDFSGIYIFFNKNKKAVYVGISRTIIRRIRQHFISPEHNQSSLVYLMARKMYKEKYETDFQGIRNSFPFNDYQPKI